MATGSLQVNRDIILATKKQYLKQQMKTIPLDAVLALAQMQSRARDFMNYSNDHRELMVIAQVSRHEVYDPVTSALQCLLNGADAISFFTDHSIYHQDLDDLLLVTRAMADVPIIYQNYPMHEYDAVSARAAGASSMVTYSSLIDASQVRKIVSMAQRWNMTTIVQVNSEEELQSALALSPHVVAVGDNLSTDISATLESLHAIRTTLPWYIKVCLMPTIHTLADFELAVEAPVDAVIVSEALFKNERTAKKLQQMMKDIRTKRQSTL
ncbi:MAG: hypothetical protein AAF846_25275 [Chloroflexota bacterium]